MVAVIALDRRLYFGNLKSFDKVVPVESFEQVMSLSKPALRRGAILVVLMLGFVALELVAFHGAVWFAGVLAIWAGIVVSGIELDLRACAVPVYDLEAPELVWSIRLQIASVIGNSAAMSMCLSIINHLDPGEWWFAAVMVFAFLGVPALIALWRALFAPSRIW